MDVLTLAQMLDEAARRVPDGAAILEEGRRLTYAEWHRQAASLAAYLHDAGLRPGDRVGLLMTKSQEAIVAFLGAAMAGGVVFTIDYNMTDLDLQRMIRLADPFAMVVSAPLLPLLARLNRSWPSGRIVVAGGAGSSETQTAWTSVVASGRPPPPVEIRADTVVYLNFTSGTTGIPKAAETTHANLFWNTRASVETFQLTPEDVHLSMFPIFGHPHELFARSLYLGGASVLVDGISPKAILKAMADQGVTCFMAVASIYASLVHHVRVHPAEVRALRVAESGGMHVAPELAAEFAARFGARLLPVWGSTETAGIAVANRPGEACRPGSMGRPCPHYDVSIIADDGREAPPGEVGELRIRGPAVCARYFRNTVETASHMVAGAMHTGDLVRRDADGFLYFVDRKSRMIKTAGLRVYPTEIEAVLHGHPAVAEAVVIRAHDPTHGEVPKAVIVTRNGMFGDKAGIRRHCEARLARHKVPRHIEFVEAIPKTPAGKVLYRKLEGV